MFRIKEWANRHFKLIIIVTGILFVALLGYLDIISGPHISLFVFYLIPLFLLSWFIGRFSGILMSLLCGSTWSAIDMYESHSYIHPLIPYWNILAASFFFLFITHIISELKRALIRERKMANIDYLTKVANSRFFTEVANLEIHRSRRYSRPFSLAYTDIDNFKEINDRCGHNEGDAFLRIIAETIKKNTRNVDLTARLGGDEFAILFPETGLEGAGVVIQRIENSIIDISKGRECSTTLSIGLVTCLKPPSSLDELIKMADGLMYAAKKSGKNQARHEIYKT